MTHTFVTMEVTDAAYDEIKAKLEAAGYDHAFIEGAMDMHGIALTRESGPPDICPDCGGETCKPGCPSRLP